MTYSVVSLADDDSAISMRKKLPMAFAYIFAPPVLDRELLHFDFAGGNPDYPTLDLTTADGKPRKGQSLMGCMLDSMPIPPELQVSVPERIVIKPGPHNYLPDFGYAADYGCFVVSDRFVEIIERLEPNTHQFLLIPEAIDINGTHLPRKYFLMNVLARLASIDIQRSTVHIKDVSFSLNGTLVKSEMLAENPGPANSKRFYADRNAIGGRHLWRGNSYGLMGRYFCSATLRQELEKEGLSRLSYPYDLQ